MTNTIKLPIGEVLASAVVGIQSQPYANLEKFGITVDEQQIKVLLIGGNSIKYDVKKDEAEAEMSRLREHLDWSDSSQDLPLPPTPPAPPPKTKFSWG